MNKCENCKFSVGYRKPAPLPTTKHSILFGLIQWEDSGESGPLDMHGYLTRLAEKCVCCQRFPKEVTKRKNEVCGEFAPIITND